MPEFNTIDNQLVIGLKLPVLSGIGTGGCPLADRLCKDKFVFFHILLQPML